MKTKIKSAKILKSAFVFILLICLVLSSVPITFAATTEVQSVEIQDVECIYHTDGYWDEDYDEDTDEFTPKYFRYSYDPSFTVTLTDGTVLESEDGYVTYEGEDYYLDYEDDQSYDNQWNVGTHTVAAEIMGVTSTINFNVVESPVSKVEVENIEMFEHTNGRWETYYDEASDLDLEYYFYNIDPVFTVTLKDGTVLESVYTYDSDEEYSRNCVEYNDTDYFLNFKENQSYDDQWGLGTRTITAEILGCESTFEVSVVESPVSKVKVENIEVFEHTNGHWETYFNDETGRFDLKWYHYDVDPAFTVTLKDGTVLESKYEPCYFGGNFVEYNDEVYLLDCYQDYENQWNVGTNTVTASIMGYETTFEVSVVESPVSKVEASDVELIENTNGRWDVGYNSETDDCDLSYSYYYVYYVDTPSFTVTLKDGSVLESEDGWVTYEGEDYYFDFNTEQSYENQWGVGTHKVTAEVMGFEASFNVIIEPSPVKSVEIQDVSFIENTNGYWEEIYNAETDDYDLVYYCYYLGSQDYSYTVTLDDGTVLESEDGYVEYKGISYGIYCDSDQSYENQWGVGTNKATAEVMGFEASFNVIIEPSPVKSVEVQDLNYKQYTNGCWDEGYNPDSDDWDGEFYYYYVDPAFTVTLNDGTVLRSEDGCVNYKGVDYELDFDTNQDYETQWGVGTHTVEAEIMGAQTSFDVTISNDVSGYKLGDVNLDGNVNVKDATYIQRMVVEEAGLTVTDVQKELADVNGDGTISVKDATQIQIIVVNT